VARIGYLQEASKTLAQQALEGKGEGSGGGLTGVIGGAVGIATLKAALEIAQSRRRN